MCQLEEPGWKKQKSFSVVHEKLKFTFKTVKEEEKIESNQISILEHLKSF